MKIVDLDKVRWVDGFYDMTTGEQYAPMMFKTEEWIEWSIAEAKVDAIPIEWMKKFANERALNDGMDGYWHFWGTDLLQMIELWEKENDKGSE